MVTVLFTMRSGNRIHLTWMKRVSFSGKIVFEAPIGATNG